MNWVTVLRFARVLDLRFSDFELGLDAPNHQDFAYALIALVDSEILKSFAHSKALTRTAMPVLNHSDLHHYRIAFDDHGVYDIVCVRVEVSYERVTA